MSDPLSTVSSALIGEIFVERGHITPAQLEEALATQAETGELLGEILVSRYNVPRVELAGVLAEQWATMERGGGVAPNEPMAEAAAHYAAESPTDSTPRPRSTSSAGRSARSSSSRASSRPVSSRRRSRRRPNPASASARCSSRRA